MKFKILLALLVMTVQASAQRKAPKEEYFIFNSEFKSIDKLENAVYLGILKKDSDTGWKWNMYNTIGPLISSSHFKDANLKILHGRQLFYHKSGYLDSAGTMIDNLEQGDWLYYNDTGKIMSRKTYDNGTLVSVTDLSADTICKKEKEHEDEKESEFPGGIPGWIRYLNKNLKYPDRALKANITGKVIAIFDVGITGEVGTVEIFKSVELSVDEETMRLIKISPKWTPAWQNGQPVKSYKKQPLVYRFS